MADWVARVLVEGRDAGLELLKEGLCWVYEKYVGEASPEIQTGYRAAQIRQARVMAGSSPGAAVGVAQRETRE